MNEQEEFGLLANLDIAIAEGDAHAIRDEFYQLMKVNDVIKERVQDLELQLAMVQFDRDCLLQESACSNNTTRGTIEPEDQWLVQRLVENGIPRDRKLQAVKFIKDQTKWSLMECKKWVEQHFF